MQFTKGDRVDRFELEGILGEGGQGQVWKARDLLEPHRSRALKLIPLSLTRGSLLERARREAHALAKLSHPSLVACDGLFEDLKKDVLGLVMDFVSGAALSQAAKDPRFGERHARFALTHIAEALGYLHQCGVVHRDIKLENVLCTDEFWETPEASNSVKVVDLGIAIDAGAQNRLTREGGLVGTLSYLAPEALDPGTFEGSTADPRLDVFAFGVLAARLLTNKHPAGLPLDATPFVFAEAYRTLSREKRRLPIEALPGSFGELLSDALVLDPSARIADGRALALRMRGETLVPLRRGEDAPETRRASPDAMFDDTARALTRPTGSHASAQTVSPLTPPELTPARPAPLASVPKALEAPKAPSEPQTGGKKTLALVAVLMLGTGAAIAVAVAGRESTPSEAPTASASATPSASVTPEVSDAQTAASDAGDDADGDAMAVGPLPAECEDVCPCCPSGSSCGEAGCDAMLDPTERFRLRLGDVLRAGDLSLASGHPTARVCVQKGDPGAQCLAVVRTQEDRDWIPITAQALMGATVRIEQELSTDGGKFWSGMAEHTLPQDDDGLRRVVLCKGLLLENLAGHVPVARLVLYVDPDGDTPPERCPPGPAQP